MALGSTALLDRSVSERAEAPTTIKNKANAAQLQHCKQLGGIALAACLRLQAACMVPMQAHAGGAHDTPPNAAGAMIKAGFKKGAHWTSARACAHCP